MSMTDWFWKNNSGEIARSRLKLLLISDKAQISPRLITLIRDDMVGVLSRYAEIDAGAMDIRLTCLEAEDTREMSHVISATFPIRQFTMKRNEECF